MRVRCALFLAAAAILGVAAPAAAGPPGSSDPVPIPGGFDLNGTFYHVFAPGPTDLGFQGTDVEPSTLTNVNGFSGLAYLGGTATAADGSVSNVGIDIRVFQGTYVSCDGTHHRGTFAFL